MQNQQGLLILTSEKLLIQYIMIFILKVLQQVGFGPKATNFLMAITAKQQKVSINNIEGPCFPLKRGVRQGNPISPLIFILILETFLARLSKEMRNRSGE